MARPPLPQRTGKQVRCAIYTRKSTEEGLEQEFNSLDAQREACAAYILSQRHEGWTLVPDLYDDGGFSGGNMERPGLKQLLADVALGKVDVIVVYKVDRLTRSLADFSKIVDVLEKADASFVSVTQAFNTTTSMGRLMLNVLLSFAQFEREVTGERIRDKVAASKRKGMWMGGNIPLGYDVRERKLVVNEAEAVTVRLIFARYLELGSTGALAADLARQGVVSKVRTLSDGSTAGGRPMTVGPLCHLLRNPLYIGQVRHKDETFAGEHQGIVEPETFGRVQRLMAEQRSNGGAIWSATHPSPLASRISDGEGRPMAPNHATKQSRRYRYYVTRAGLDRKAPADAWRIPAAEVEHAVERALADWLTNRAADELPGIEAARRKEAQHAAARLAARLDGSPRQLQELLVSLDARVALSLSALVITLDAAATMQLLEVRAQTEGQRVTISVPIAIIKRGQELRLAIAPEHGAASGRVDETLVQLLGRAERAQLELQSQPPADKTRRATLVQLARLRTLAPDIVTAILDGRQPPSLTARQLLRTPRLPLAWSEQRTLLGFR